MEVEFNRLKLKKDDFLVIKLNSEGLTEDELKQKLFDIRNDDFVKYVEEKGNKVFVTYSGVDLSILRMQDNDKVVAYIDVTNLNEEEEEKYSDFVKFKLGGNIESDKLIVVPRRKNSPELAVRMNEEVK